MSSRIHRLFMTLLAGIGLLATVARAEPVLTDAWIRFLPGDGPMAGYFTLHNDTGQAITLTGVGSPAFARIMLHRTVERAGQVSMQHVDKIEVPAGGELRFEPGDHHLMLMQRQRDVQPGGQIELTLEFADGRMLTADFTVKAPWQE